MQTASKYLMKKTKSSSSFSFLCMPLSFKTEIKRKCMVHNVFRFLVLKLDEVILPHRRLFAPGFVPKSSGWKPMNGQSMQQTARVVKQKGAALSLVSCSTNRSASCACHSTVVFQLCKLYYWHLGPCCLTLPTITHWESAYTFFLHF